jgi:hypothetical protein
VNQTLIFASFLAPTRYKMCLYITEYIERALAIPTFLLNGESFEDFATADADAGLISPLTYMQLFNEKHSSPVELIAAPVFRGADEQDIPPGLVDIVVRRESKLHAESDLENCIWAYCAGKTTVEDQARYAQNPLSLTFRSTIEATSPAQALRLLLDGRADATIIDTRLFALVRHNSPHLCERLRTMNTCCHTPGPLVVVASHVHPRLKCQIQEALVNMHKHPLFAQQLQERNIERFVAVTDDYYQTMQARYWEKYAVTMPTETPSPLPVPASI